MSHNIRYFHYACLRFLVKLLIGISVVEGLKGPLFSRNNILAMNFDSSGGSAGGRSFVAYNVYKGKAALTMKPVAPTFSALPTGSRVLAKDGGLLLEIAPVLLVSLL